MKQMLLNLSQWRPFANQQTSTHFVQRSKMMEYDQPLVWVTLILMVFGMVMVYSASISLPDSPKYANYKNTHFLVRQAMFILVSIAVSFFVFRIRVFVYLHFDLVSLGVDSRCGQGRQWCEALVGVQRFQLATIRTDEVVHGVVCR